MAIAELEQAEALSYLYQWLKNHPKYGTLAPPQQPDTLFYNDVSTPIEPATLLLYVLIIALLSDLMVCCLK